MKSSVALLDFYEWWLDQALSPEPVDSVITCGLCYNLEIYTGDDNYLYMILFDEMMDQFDDALLEVEYPFNDFYFRGYWVEKVAGTQHKNFNRLAWVYDRLEEAKRG